MLQQTQVATVLGYYDALPRSAFPTCGRWPPAPQDDVLGAVERPGLLQPRAQPASLRAGGRGAHGGEFPRTAAELQTLPGIGRSTAAAIAAFCFGERVAILDGNVKRVLTRVLGFDGDLASARATSARCGTTPPSCCRRRRAGGHAALHAGPDGPGRDRLPAAQAELPALPGQRAVRGAARGRAGALSRSRRASCGAARSRCGCCRRAMRRAACGWRSGRRAASGPGSTACRCSTAATRCWTSCCPTTRRTRARRRRPSCTCSRTRTCTCIRCRSTCARGACAGPMPARLVRRRASGRRSGLPAPVRKLLASGG